MPAPEPTRIVLTTRPDREHVEPRIDVVRAPETGVLSGISLSHDLSGAYTHWYRGRTRPCTQPNCEACAENTPWRWHGYLMLFGPKTHRIVLLEVTKNVCPTIDDYMAAKQTLRGARINITRKNRKKNARVILTVTASDIDDRTLPPCPPVAYHLAKLWDSGMVNLKRGPLDGTPEHLPLEILTPTNNGAEPSQPPNRK